MKRSIPLFVFCFMSMAAWADNFYVTNSSDTGVGSLRVAVANANNHAGADSIVLLLNQFDTIKLSGPLNAIVGSLVITGSPCQNPTITIADVGMNNYSTTLTGDIQDSILEVDNINFIRATFGPQGGTAVSGGNVVLHGCYFYGNMYTDMACFDISDAAAVVADTLRAYNCVFENNIGRGWESYGVTVTVGRSGHFFNCLFAGNTGNGAGSAIWGDLSEVIHCTFINNTNLAEVDHDTTFNIPMTGGVLFGFDTIGQVISNNIYWNNTMCATCNTLNFAFRISSAGNNVLPDVNATIDTNFVRANTDVSGVDPMLGSIIYTPGCVPAVFPACRSVAVNVDGNGGYDGAYQISTVNLGPDKYDTIMPGESVDLDSVFSTTDVTVQWMGQVQDSILVGPGTYTIVATNSSGCSDTAILVVVYNSVSSITQVNGDIFNLYPNPAKDHVIIETSKAENNEWLQITDVSGRKISSQQITATSMEIETSNLTGGIYFVRIDTINGCFIKKLVIQ